MQADPQESGARIRDEAAKESQPAERAPGEPDSSALHPPSGALPDGVDGETELEAVPQALPRCPNCGWQDVRLSHSSGVVDSFFRKLSIIKFKCRSCGTRFRRRYRIEETDQV